MSSTSLPRVAVLYDTSYLMDRRGLVHQACSPLRKCNVTNIVVQEVQQEIENHIQQGPEAKKQAAASARKRIVELMQQRPSLPYLEPHVRGLEPPIPPSEHPLGADSETDRLLLAYAQRLACSGSYDAIVVASNDGGIQISVEKILVAGKRSIFCVADPGNELQVAPLREALGLKAATASRVAPPEAPSPMAVLAGHRENVLWLAFVPDGSTLLSGSKDSVSSWRVADGHPTATFTITGGMTPSPSRRVFVGRGQHGSLSLYTGAGQPLGAVNGSEHHSICEFCLSPDDLSLATATRGFSGPRPPVVPPCLQLWRIGDPNPVLTLPSPNQFTHHVTALAWSPDNRLLAVGHFMGLAYLVNVASGRVETTLAEGWRGPGYQPSPRPEITRLAFSPTCAYLAWGTGDGELTIYDLSLGRPLTKRQVASGERILSLAFSPEGKFLAVGIPDSSLAGESRIFLFRTADGECLATLRGPSSVLTFTPDGGLLIGSSPSNFPVVHPCRARAWSVPQGEVVASFSCESLAGPGAVVPCSVSTDGRFVATANSYRKDALGVRPEDFRIRLYRFLEDPDSSPPGSPG